MSRETPEAFSGPRERRTDRAREVFVLRPAGEAVSQRMLPSTAGEPTSRITEDRVRETGQPIERLCELLSRFLGRPVVDETGLDGVYDWDIPYRPGEPEVVMDALRKRLALEVVPDLRRVPPRFDGDGGGF